jgi:hypothetical protein
MVRKVVTKALADTLVPQSAKRCVPHAVVIPAPARLGGTE